MHSTAKTWGLAIIGATIGAVAGYLAYRWLLTTGFYALILPGALIGWGASFFLQQRNVPIGLFAASLALLVGIYSEWSTRPFVANDTLVYFLMHLHHLSGGSMLMLGLGVLFGFVFGVGRDRFAA